MEQLFADLLVHLDEDPTRAGLLETPKRATAAWRFWTEGRTLDPADVFKTFEDGAEGYHDLVFQGALPFWSSCEHHLAPFFGVAHIGYIPSGRIIGLSKFARLLDIFARRLTVQERITTQVADALVKYLNPLGVGVVLQARHTCLESRGVQKAGTVTHTSALRGCIKDEPSARAEFMNFVSCASQGLRAL